MSPQPRLEYHLINAFTTDSPHSGNQAAVVLFTSTSDPRANDDDFLLKTARDFGYAETAYLVPIDEQAGQWSLRWFTIYTVRIISLSANDPPIQITTDRAGSPNLWSCNLGICESRLI